ncbi:MAG: hypothetical protein M1827_005335 [Pycnora praestabilis]|nr:MAG: hypothetical protein M1827_005335 [Pycnora praestabilis]
MPLHAAFSLFCSILLLFLPTHVLMLPQPTRSSFSPGSRPIFDDPPTLDERLDGPLCSFYYGQPETGACANAFKQIPETGIIRPDQVFFTGRKAVSPNVHLPLYFSGFAKGTICVISLTLNLGADEETETWDNIRAAAWRVMNTCMPLSGGSQATGISEKLAVNVYGRQSEINTAPELIPIQLMSGSTCSNLNSNPSNPSSSNTNYNSGSGSGECSLPPRYPKKYCRRKEDCLGMGMLEEMVEAEGNGNVGGGEPWQCVPVIPKDKEEGEMMLFGARTGIGAFGGCIIGS